MSRILLVEDDKEISMLLNRTLTNEGYSVRAIFDGGQVAQALLEDDYDLIILDLMLPTLGGLDILQEVRQTKNIPILILSAKDTEHDKVLGLSLGADDYIAKPFRVGELLARVKALLRRFLYLNNFKTSQTNEVLFHRGIELNCDNYTCKVQGTEVELTAKEFAILELLIRHPLKVFSKSQIFNKVWNQTYNCDENTVTVHVNRLRNKIEPDRTNPQYIQTVWGIGYRFVGEKTV
ncbi:response regulator transcription factor [Priestia megaterium]|uniref:response regulator transcription factor n=1 Tax=Priestia megaterium TaxID=1404 RepID=UPI00234E5DB2|nr:response regulator transcription factor [Priestia megaterium]MDC7783993.1 response regulator transcription factor [Priestia megaterium]